MKQSRMLIPVVVLFLCIVNGCSQGIPAKRRFEGLPCTAGSDPCPNGPPGKILPLKMSRSGADIVLSWTPDPNAGGGYNIYMDNTKENIPILRSPAYTPAATNVSVPYVFPNGVNTGLLYFQVVGVCPDGKTEGSN